MADHKLSEKQEGQAGVPDLPPWPHGPTAFERRYGNGMTRVVVAIVAIPLILGLILIGGWPFVLLVTTIAVGALLEFYWMLERLGVKPNKKLGVVMAVLICLLHNDALVYLTMFSPGTLTDNEFKILLLRLAKFSTLIIPIIITVFIVELWRRQEDALLSAVGTVVGLFYPVFLLASLLSVDAVSSVITRGPVEGAIIETDWVLLVLAGIWTCDTAAYVFGKAFGRTKLLEHVSPKKTWEGALAGALFAIAAVVAIGTWVIDSKGYNVTDLIVIGVIAGVFGQVGDLVESHFKRSAGVKDSSQLIPGHGGILDRFDSLIIAAPLVAFYFEVLRVAFN